MITFKTLTDYGQLKPGDAVLIRDRNDVVFPATVKDVLSPGGAEEEILIGKSKNLYFIVGMYLDGKSWVKECAKIVNGKIYSLSNSMESYT